jgi:hypothetical protein
VGHSPQRINLICVRAELPLFVRSTGKALVARAFLFDTGANVTEVDEAWARQNRIPIQGSVVNWSVTTGSGTTSYSGIMGTIRIRVPRWSGVEFEWPCFFRKNRPANLPPQLGLAGVIKDIRLTVDGTPTALARHGTLTVEEL